MRTDDDASLALRIRIADISRSMIDHHCNAPDIGGRSALRWSMMT